MQKSWERVSLSMSGAEYEIQEALTALRRLLDADSLRTTTRAVVTGAVIALENDLEMRQA